MKETKENGSLVGCVTVFVYGDGYIVQPSPLVGVRLGTSRVLEDSTTTEAGKSTVAERKLRVAIRELAAFTEDNAKDEDAVER